MENLQQSIGFIGFRFYAIHFIALIFLIVLLWFAYIKIMYPFWNSQPVFHSYDFWRYWITMPFIIMHKRGQKPGKFCDFDNVITMNFLDMPTELYSGMLDLLQCHYISDESVLFLFHRENLDAYFAGHLFPSYVSFYMNTYSDIDVLDVSGVVGSGDIVMKKRADACITSRSVVLKFGGVSFNIYFMDFITSRRGGDILTSRKLMATHCWRTLDFVNGVVGVSGDVDKFTNSDKRSELVEKINAAFFRKEGTAFAGIRAFFAFDASIFKVSGSFVKPLLPVHFSLVSIHAKNVGLLTDFFEEVGSQFDLFIMTSIANLMELVKRRVLFLFLVRRGDNSFCFYAFRDTRTQYDFANSNNDSVGDGDGDGVSSGGGGGALLQFVCSIQKSNSHELFYRGFLNALHDILNHGSGKAFRYLMVDDVGDNRAIANDFPASTLLEKIAVNYYGYNLVMPTVNYAFVLV
jgi:hypothetical protein